MRKQVRNIVSLIGVICSVVGAILAVPFFLTGKYIPAIIATIFVVIGLVFLAFAFGD